MWGRLLRGPTSSWGAYRQGWLCPAESVPGPPRPAIPHTMHEGAQECIQASHPSVQVERQKRSLISEQHCSFKARFQGNRLRLRIVEGNAQVLLFVVDKSEFNRDSQNSPRLVVDC